MIIFGAIALTALIAFAVAAYIGRRIVAPVNAMTGTMQLLSSGEKNATIPATDYTNEIAVLWLMILFALTWDILGGQMGYNSLGNIFFFGAGMYLSAVVQIGLFYDVAMYTSAARTTHIDFSIAQYFTGLGLGLLAAGVGSALLAVIIGFIVFGLRGPYFAIGTLGVAVAAAELVASWEWVGAASGISLPVFPGQPETQRLFFYLLMFTLSFVLLLFLRWLYGAGPLDRLLYRWARGRFLRAGRSRARGTGRA